MTLALEIIRGQTPNYDYYLQKGESLDDIDEYGFTALIESIICKRPDVLQQLLDRGVAINKPDVAGRTALHWAVDSNEVALTRHLLKLGANPNAYSASGMPVLAYPLLRRQNDLKHLLCQHGAKLDFAYDFSVAKLLGHRFELTGYVDILNAEGAFIELDYEGFVLEFTVAILQDALRRFCSSYSTRHWRGEFPYLLPVIAGLETASALLKYQSAPALQPQDLQEIDKLLQEPLLILPAASRGHALGFVRYQKWWAKIDRGENSQREGSINIYEMTRPEALNTQFLQEFLYKKQSREYFHQQINQQLGLVPLLKYPMTAQIVGNCSWANIQAVVPVSYAMQQLAMTGDLAVDKADALYNAWVAWDQERAIDECIHRFYLADAARKASLASMLGAVLFQACDYDNRQDVLRAEKMLTILTLPQYYYILESYLEIYCVKRLTRRGNNLLKILDDCGINPEIGVSAVATGLKKRTRK